MTWRRPRPAEPEPPPRKGSRAVVALILLLAGGALLAHRLGVSAPPPEAKHDSGEAIILEAYRERAHDLPVAVEGEVERTLADDLEGSRHQRFILRLPGGHTLLVSHNIDLAPRVPLAAGDHVQVLGRYEWNDRGGVVHWTHHDPRGEDPGGWIRLGDRTYR
ncbi:MAG: DUF3465 domain-containing protein [Acidobacteria bacterium]|nr:DUF3465 domain-containing protein [Acidobacteriota bacterium]